MVNAPSTPSPAAGRLLILAAALLWSLSGAFTNLLTQPTWLGLHEPKLHALQIAAFRVLFAGLIMVPLLRPRDVAFRAATLWTALCFAIMNAMYITAQAIGPVSTAVLLQYTAPMWLFLVGIFFLGEKPDRRGVVALLAGCAGIAVILAGGWQGGNPYSILLGLGSGVTFAGIVLGLRVQRDLSSAWLTFVNHMAGAIVLLPLLFWLGMPTPTQLLVLAIYGAVQLGFPYLLIARGLKSVSTQEAGALTLLEPLLVPVWAYFVAPDKERPTVYIFLGGALILLGLAYRYWPSPTPESKTKEPGTKG